MLEIKKLSIAYDPASDRLTLDVKGETQTCRTQLTRRLAMRWLKTLCSWLEGRVEDDAADVQRMHKLEQQHEQALTAAAHAPRTGREDEALPCDSDSAVQLLTRIEFARRKNLLGVLLYSDADIPVASGNFGPSAAHILVARLSRSMTQAGWGELLPIPEWGRLKAKERQGKKRPVLH